MKISVALLTASLAAFVTGCTGEDSTLSAAEVAAKAAETPKDDCANCADASMVSMTPEAKSEDLVKSFTLEDYTPISEILAALEEFEGKRVRVKGEAVGVCEKKGCWVTLKSDAANDKALRVKVEDGEIVFPVTVKGNPVEVEGIVEKSVMPEETYRAALKKRAEDKGETFDPASVTGPLVTWQLRGLAAKWDS